MLGTVTRAGRLLDLFTPEFPEWGPTAAARELGIAKSQAHELLTSLTAIGLLRRGRGGQFRLGWRTLALGRDVLRTQFPDEVFRLIGGLAHAFQEPVHLVAFDRAHVAVIARRAGGRGTDPLLPCGSLDAYLHACAMSKALLADLPGDTVEGILPERLHRHTEESIFDHAVLRGELAQIRADRIAYDRGEVADGLRAVAVPIRDAAGDTVAALGLWTGAARWATAEGEMTRAVVGSGQRIELLMRSAAPVSAPLVAA
jgi:DNA-binding IclR family transcriptional regulator